MALKIELQRVTRKGALQVIFLFICHLTIFKKQFTLTMKKYISLIVCVSAMFVTSRTMGQADLNDLLKGSQADANYLAQGYLTPVLNAIGSGLNQGWYNTAGTHKKFGFDLTISVSSIQFPSEDLFYAVDNSKLQTMNIDNPVNGPPSGMAPTFIGPDPAPTYIYKDPITQTPISGTEFQGPPGIDIQSVPLGGLPLPMVNLGIGIPVVGDVKIRWASVSSDAGAKVNLLGFAVQHDIKQHIPGLKEVPFDLSALIGYTSFSSEVGFDSSNPSQVGKADFSATTIQGLIGKKFSVLTVYGGVGYNFSSGSFKAVGSYPDATTGITLTDPVSISSSVSGPRITGGLRLKLAIFTLHGDYTFQRYNTITLGFGIAVR